MRSLIALDIAPSKYFLDCLNRIWDDGNAVLPVDQRLPESAKKQLVRKLGASWVVTNEDEKIRLEHGFEVGDDDALVIATSGTTGDPKGVVHTHASISAAVIAGGSRLGCNADDFWLSCLPLAHVGGLSVLLRAQHYRSRLSIADRVDQPTIDTATKSGANLTSLVPTALQKLDLTNFRAVLVGGSAIISDLPLNAITTYGLTETMGGVAYNGVALDDVEIRLSNESEIQIRGAMLFRAYRDETEPKTDDGWFSTGDLGELADGALTVYGRKDDLINTGGYKVWPTVVEESIQQLDEIEECVVRGLPDQKWGTAVCAWIVMRIPSESINLGQLRDHVKRSLPDYCAPRRLFIVDQIPRTTLGKVRISDLPTLGGQL